MFQFDKYLVSTSLKYVNMPLHARYSDFGWPLKSFFFLTWLSGNMTQSRFDLVSHEQNKYFAEITLIAHIVSCFFPAAFYVMDTLETSPELLLDFLLIDLLTKAVLIKSLWSGCRYLCFKPFIWVSKAFTPQTAT